MIATINDIENKLELHYYFGDHTHTMNAELKNKCEREIIAIAKEIALVLEVDLDFDTEALLEGGIKDRLIAITKNKFLQGVLTTIIGGVIVYCLTTDRELAMLQKEELRLSIEKLKQDIKKNSDENNKINIENSIILFNTNLKIVKHKSNFYKNLNGYNKVTRISTAIMKNNYVDSEVFVERKDFEKYILDTDELPVEKDDKAVIEIISPVLKKGNYKWKGIYLNNRVVIDFSMKDPSYKEEIVREGISFKNGTCIDCTLEISKKIDEVGDIKVTGYTVSEVINTHDEVSSIETIVGKKKRRKKESEGQQLDMFDII